MMLTILYWLLFMKLSDNITKCEQNTIKRCLEEYLVTEGKLWQLQKGLCQAVKCLPRNKGLHVVLSTHKDIGHWGHDILTLKLHD